MPSTKKRPRSPTNDEPPQKRPKTIARAQILPPKVPKLRSRGPKDQRLMALQKLYAMRESIMFKSSLSRSSAVQTATSTTTGVGRATATVDPAPQSPTISPTSGGSDDLAPPARCRCKVCDNSRSRAGEAQGDGLLATSVVKSPPPT